MKLINTILLAMFAMAGLVLAGSDHPSMTTQVIITTAGVSVFAVSMWGIVEVHR